ncbi:hypothetical protein M0R45_034867 [Rubus argutus]|uniref:Uncharacterized protein n=1 Tax=Rubus argutus TaxID=59490 RepID=A0AAW1VRG7_RUBAR
MNGQYLCNRQITVSYAYKKDTKGERHGIPAERVLAASNPTSKSRPHTLFASGPPTLPSGSQANGTMGAPVPPRPFANGGVGPGLIPPLRPPPPQDLLPQTCRHPLHRPLQLLHGLFHLLWLWETNNLCGGHRLPPQMRPPNMQHASMPPPPPLNNPPLPPPPMS